MTQAYQCDKCQTFYTDNPNILIIRDPTEQIVLEKDICQKCLEEITALFNQDRWRRL